MCLEWAIKLITWQTFIILCKVVPNAAPSAVEVAPSKCVLLSLEVKNKNLLLLWELLGFNYNTFPC